MAGLRLCLYLFMSFENSDGTIRMHGLAFDDSGDKVNRDVPIADVEAYKAAGYIEGYLYTEADAAAQAEVAETPKVLGAGRKRK